MVAFIYICFLILSIFIRLCLNFLSCSIRFINFIGLSPPRRLLKIESTLPSSEIFNPVFSMSVLRLILASFINHSTKHVFICWFFGFLSERFLSISAPVFIIWFFFLCRLVTASDEVSD